MEVTVVVPATLLPCTQFRRHTKILSVAFEDDEGHLRNRMVFVGDDSQAQCIDVQPDQRLSWKTLVSVVI